MADLDYVKVVGRFGLNVGDVLVGDADDYPDTKWCDTGTITITPLNSLFKVLGGSPVPWTGGNSAIVAKVDANGYVSYNGKTGVWVVDFGSAKVTPKIASGFATHRIVFSGMKAGGVDVAFDSQTVRLSADMVDSITGAIDLTLALPANPGSSVSTVAGPRGQSVVGLDISDTGHLMVTLSNGSTTSIVDAGALPVRTGTPDPDPEPTPDPAPVYSVGSINGSVNIDGSGVRVLSLDGTANVSLDGDNGASVALVVHLNGQLLNVEGHPITKDGLFVLYRAEGTWLLATGSGSGSETTPTVPVSKGNALPFTLPHTFVANGSTTTPSASDKLPFTLPHTFVGA